MGNAISWFDIPVADMDRAIKFYGTLLDKKLSLMEGSPSPYVLLNPDDFESVGGGLALLPDHKPSKDSGTVVYLNGGNDLNDMLARIEPAGGKVIQEKMGIGEGNGFIAYFLDTEGNKVALHSPA